tara:strand:- start:5075 stop:5551 length:477 start_codon:yes stop_codon:yes gene_type:complete
MNKNLPRQALVVCLGNICRSPMAEGVLRHHIQSMGLRIKVDSAGTSGHHLDAPPDLRAQQEMRRRGMDISSQRSRPLVRKDFERFDVILVMDHANLEDTLALAGQRTEWRNKVHLFLEDSEVPDPYYGGASGFVQVHDLVDSAARKWVARWRGHGTHP